MKLAARHLWLFARVELGISRAEFNAMSPADWKVALRVWKQRELRRIRREDELVARLALFINCSVVPRKKTDPVPTVADFLPIYGKKKAQVGRRPSTAELIQKIESHFGD